MGRWQVIWEEDEAADLYHPDKVMDHGTLRTAKPGERIHAVTIYPVCDCGSVGIGTTRGDALAAALQDLLRKANAGAKKDIAYQAKERREWRKREKAAALAGGEGELA